MTGIEQTERRGRRLARLSAITLLTTLLAAGCSPPPVEEVIPRGQLPTGDLWCQLLSTEEVETLLGEGDLDRVRQVGDDQPDPERRSFDCNVTWADEAAPTFLVDSLILRLRGGQAYLDTLANLRDLLGTRGQRLDSH